MQRFRSLAISILYLACLCTPLSSGPVVSAQVSDVDHLTALATASVVAYNDALVSKDLHGSLRGLLTNPAFRHALEAHIPVIVNRRSAMAQSGMRYSSHRTTLTIESTEIEGDTATQKATENVTLQLQIRGEKPQITKYSREHLIRFVKNSAGWNVESDTILIPPDSGERILAPITTPPMRVASPTFKSPSPDRRSPQEGSDLIAATATYSATSAANYALQYVDSPNSSYRFYSENDCTNFVSQALKTGGWPFDQTGDRTLSNTWYYGSFTFTTSYSWAGAHNFHLFFKQSGRGTFAQNASELVKGDIAQADWGPTPDGNISHTMIVTKVTNGVPMLTYHSGPATNRSIYDIAAENPGTNWYGLRMKPSFTY